MKILFIGDSITKGTLGESFVNLIANKIPNLEIKNLGENGETLNLIVERLLIHLKKESNYDYLIFQGGYNDILLPTFLTRGKLFSFAYHQQLKKRHSPFTSINILNNFLNSSFDELNKTFNGKVIVLTIGCIGENLSSELNQKRNSINEILKSIALKNGYDLADTKTEFERILAHSNSSNYCLDSFWNVTLFDKLKNNTSALSISRHLELTIDGVHLNKKGAEIFAREVLRRIEN